MLRSIVRSPPHTRRHTATTGTHDRGERPAPLLAFLHMAAGLCSLGRRPPPLPPEDRVDKGRRPRVLCCAPMLCIDVHIMLCAHAASL